MEMFERLAAWYWRRKILRIKKAGLNCDRTWFEYRLTEQGHDVNELELRSWIDRLYGPKI